jgi:proteasome lid subunit RPN8/RPN11
MIALTDTLKLKIVQHALAELPREACGLIVRPSGKRMRLVFWPCRNLAPGVEQFVMDPRDYEEAADSGAVLAVVHSHPHGSSTPSEADRAACEASRLPWAIMAMPSTDIEWLSPSGYAAALEGREYAFGIFDCWTLIRDFYERETGRLLGNPPRCPHWWQQGEDLYRTHLPEMGFERVPAATDRGDIIVMRLGASPVPQHAGVYLGDGTMLHHMEDRPSLVTPYGGYWAQHTEGVWRLTAAAREPIVEAADAA